MLLVLATAGCASGGPSASSAPATATGPAPVERLLAASKIESVLVGRAPEMTRRVAFMAGDLTDPELERLVPAVQSGFAPDRMRADVADALRADAAVGQIERVVDRLETGASAEMARRMEGYVPEGTLEAFARALVDDPPPDERLAAAVRWTETQGAGDFYVLLDQALTEASYSILREFRLDTPAYEPPPPGELEAQLQNSFNAAVVTFLHRLEPVPTDLLERATAEYATADGQWFVQSYALAVAQAVRSAGRRTVEALRPSEE